MNQATMVQIGIIVIFIGFIIVFSSMFFSAKRTAGGTAGNIDEEGRTDKESRVKVGVVGLIGPVPFGFGSDKKMLVITMIIAAVMILLFFLLRLRFFS
ncbi:DUF131 domain-containing protein [Candidatus Woesearchaeota archaeon]|nr:DUF131 domain-containing protein [Candidatus Woesearchaeota archaeon]